MSANVTHHSADLNGFRMHYVEAGDGPPLVLLHGWPQSWYTWRHVIPALAEHYRVIAPDLRGLGDSGTPATGYDKRTLAADVKALIETLGHGDVMVAAHDWGGAVAYFLAYDNPGLVSRLAILDMLPALVRAGEPVDLTMAIGLWQVFFHGGNVDFAEQLASQDVRRYITYFLTSTSINHSPAAFSPEDIDEYVRVNSRPGVLKAGFRYYETALREDAENIVGCDRKLEMPVLALGGASFLGDLVPVWQTVAEQVTGGAIADSGHFVPEEQPQVVIEELLDFFPRNPEETQ